MTDIAQNRQKRLVFIVIPQLRNADESGFTKNKKKKVNKRQANKQTNKEINKQLQQRQQQQQQQK